jgi:hypothetical protein
MDANQAAQLQVMRLHQQAASGARWFFWIAGLSIINACIHAGGSKTTFLIGLGVTQIVSAIARHADSLAAGVGLALNVFIAGVFIIFGVFAGKRHSWAFVTGMILYALDGVLMVLFRDLPGTAFHVLALVFIFMGFKASRTLNEMIRHAPAPAAAPAAAPAEAVPAGAAAQSPFGHKTEPSGSYTKALPPRE